MIGFDQILKKTPAVVKHIRATLIYTITGSIVFASKLAPKFGLTPLDYAEWCAISIFIVKAVSMLFGVSDKKEVEQATKVLEEKAPETLKQNIP